MAHCCFWPYKEVISPKWKEFLKVGNPDLAYENMQKDLTGKIFKITPKRIKLFDQKFFKDVDDGEEPVLEL